MLIHMFVFRWHEHATAVDKARAIADIRGFAGAIPGLLEVHVGPNFSRHRSVYESGGVMKFADEAALLAYNSHPLHLTLLDWLVPLIEPIEVDFHSSSPR